MNYFFPLTDANWGDLVQLFGDRGACGGCWCMYWRLNAATYNANKGDRNRKSFRKLVSVSSPGMLGYVEDTVAGWCAIAPREEYTRLERSRILKPVDDKKVWSVSCFFIAKEFRKMGLSVPLLKAAVDFAIAEGATIVEGYPHETGDQRIPDVFIWTGLAATFKKAGFKEVARRSAGRPIMRFLKQ